MRFTPKTDKEIAEMNLWPAGEYPFEITEAENTTSKSGNEMIRLKLRVFNEDGGYKFVDDYLLESIAHKLRHAAEATGNLSNYENGELQDYMLKDKSGVLKLGIEKDKSGQYPDKNKVVDYVVDKEARSNGVSSAPARQAAPAELDDEIPF
jgi:hypothetical protein